jgi:hypothetical protein
MEFAKLVMFLVNNVMVQVHLIAHNVTKQFLELKMDHDVHVNLLNFYNCVRLLIQFVMQVSVI